MLGLIGNPQMDAILYLWMFGISLYYWKFYSQEIERFRNGNYRATELKNALISCRVFLLLTIIFFFNFIIAGLKSWINILGKF